jgi:hypothetical protein
MGLFGWAIFVLLACAGAAWAFFIYRRRELPGRGRPALAVLRTLALALLLLVILDPQLPAGDGTAARRAPVVLLDGSLSMTLPAAAGGTRFDAARAEAARLAGSAPVLVFERTPRSVPAAALAAESPGDGGARLLPALRAAAESGARRIVVVSDGRIADAAEVARWLPALQLDVEFRYVEGDEVANRALVEVEAPAWAESGRPVEVRFGVAAHGAVVEDSVTVRVSQDGRALGEARVALPPAGRIAGGSLSVQPTPAPGGGYVRLDIALEPADAIAADDRRAVYVYVTDEPAGVALVSFAPDWEPRFLEPVLAQALGLPVRGYLRIDGNDYRATGVGLEVGAAATEEVVRRAAGRADLLVLHGLAAAPEWARELAARHPRVLLVAGPGEAPLTTPVETGAAIAAEWFASAEPPPSPIAPLLAGVETADAPPLTSLRPVQVPAGAWVALEATRGPQGAPLPAAIGGETGGRRWALAPGDGYWRWSFRGDASRRLYTRFWGALAGWVVRERASVDGAPVRPLRRAVERGGTIVWSASGVAADSLAVRLVGEDGVVRDSALAGVRGDSIAQPAPPPGRYAWEATAFAGGQPVAAGSGELTVESYSPDFVRPVVALTN